MGLKMLVFPTVLVLAVFLIITYIHPDISMILQQHEEKVIKQGALEKVASVEKNIQALNAYLDSEFQLDQLVHRYYPETIDQERLVDMVNFLAQQSGVSITLLSLTEEKSKFIAAAPESGAEGGDAALEAVTGAAPTEEPPKGYRVEIGVLGTYESIRTFYDRLYRTDRMRSLENLVIRKVEARAQVDNPLPDGVLEGRTALRYQYSPAKRSGNALQLPIFQSSTLDMTGSMALRDFVNSPVGNLAEGMPGRSNPFQKLP